MELWDAYDDHGNLTGETLVRGEPVPEGRYHMIATVLVRHTDGDFLLMRRAPEKTWPNIWEVGVGGCALQGESADQCIVRELREETGIDRGSFTPIYRSFEDGEGAIFQGFTCVTDYPKDQIKLQKGETSAYRWLNLQDFLAFFDTECIDRIRCRLAAYVDTLR